MYLILYHIMAKEKLINKNLKSKLDISAKKIQFHWKKCVKFKNNIKDEIIFFREIIKGTVIKIEDSYKNNIISSSVYKSVMNQINHIVKLLSFFPYKITIRFIKNHSRYRLFLKIANVKVKLIEIINLHGTNNIENIIKLYMGSFDKSIIDKKYLEYINFFNTFFKTIKCELYESEVETNITFKLNTYGKSIKTNSITLSSYQLDYPSVNKYNIFTKNLLLKTMGAKIFLPLKRKLIIIYGYFQNDNMNQYKQENIFKEKYQSLEKIFENLDINDNFKYNFIESLPINHFLLDVPNKIASNCITYYNDLMKYKAKNISQIVKEFVANDIEKQKYIITLLLLDTSDNESIYLVHLLYDLLKSDGQNQCPTSYSLIFDTLHWHLKKIFYDGDEIVEEVNDKITNFNEDRIPYEKRIHLMKATEQVKSKAMDKLKEINNSKNGESTAKAQQYLDGLLKIPFGVYKKESIRNKLDEIIIKYNKLVYQIIKDVTDAEEKNSLCDIDLHHTAKLYEILESYTKSNHNPININKTSLSISKWINSVLSETFTIEKCFSKEDLLKSLKKIKVGDLKNICLNLDIKCNGKKNEIIDSIAVHKFGRDDINYIRKKCNLEKKYLLLQDTEQFINIISSLEQMNHIWSKYKDSQSKYFKNISKTLDSTVYGLEDAKNQIKRLLAQWINGNDQGYVFGFEGPPGTGKTTLAKNGIAHCLRDELDKSRPFVFIALGGSSNGSTLEGHNYTYVGSTWGRIIEGIIDSKIMNPIIYIDELDKISQTEHGKEIIGILTHLTDPSQNTEFTDKYFSGIKFDISKCLIIFSYNDPNLIDKILLDRIQRVKISPLNKVDKVMVAKKHIIPEILKNIGFTDKDICIEENTLIYLIDTYTYEAGARKLKEKLYELYREINLNYLIAGESMLPFNISREFIDKIFENYDKVDIKKIHNTCKVGLVNGLFATASGIGGITVIEAYKFISTNHLELKLTGMQGDVMKESMSVAKTLALNLIPDNIKNKLNIDNDEEKNNNKFGIHIHCPEGATPKDGPSAGTAITVAIISLLCDIPVRNTIALTGEISLNGNVMPIGGLESKIDGGKAAGVKHILCPKKNDKDLIKIRKRVNPPENKDFKVELIENIYEALNKFLILPQGVTAESYFKAI